MPGTEKWKPIIENPDAEEDVPGVLIIRIRESLDFGQPAHAYLYTHSDVFDAANTSQLKGMSTTFSVLYDANMR